MTDNTLRYTSRARILVLLWVAAIVHATDTSTATDGAAANGVEDGDVDVAVMAEDVNANANNNDVNVDDDDGIQTPSLDVDTDGQGSNEEGGEEKGNDNDDDGVFMGCNAERSSSSQELQYTPPTHFQITAHIQSDLHTGYSYFLPAETLPTSFAHLPFLECGAVGSTTEGLPLVSGVFRHVPHTALVPKRDDLDQVVLDSLEEMKQGGNENVNEGGTVTVDSIGKNSNETESVEVNDEIIMNEEEEHPHPNRPSPPKYVVALSSMEITVGGGSSTNETQTFQAGDVIFFEDTWWIDYLDINDDGLIDYEELSAAEEQRNGGEGRMKGYIMRASPESNADLNVLMLTVPNAVHRHWKNAQYAMAMARREQQRQEAAAAKAAAAQLKEEDGEYASTHNSHGFLTRQPWWKRPSSFLKKPSLQQQQQQQYQQQLSSAASAALLPKPCSLETDPAFANPTASSTTLSQHFTQHFTNLLKRSSNPHPSFLPHHHQDLLLPILAQTVAAAVGGATSLALVLQLWRIIPGPVAVGFGSACLIGAGTWGFVWLGEEIFDQWELWRERRRLERMMSEGWGRGEGGETEV